MGVVGLSPNERLIIHRVTKDMHNRTVLERQTVEGNSPVYEMYVPLN